jgi:tRNA nucleotidyltransferase (CCA-adding enzyme)
MTWEHFPHGADVGVRGIGTTREEAFAQAVSKDAVEIRCEAPDDELLFVDWLNALIYEMATRSVVFGRFEVKLHDHRLEATAWGEPLDRGRHSPKVEVKGATYTALRVGESPQGGWIAQGVVDV